MVEEVGDGTLLQTPVVLCCNLPFSNQCFLSDLNIHPVSERNVQVFRKMHGQGGVQQSSTKGVNDDTS